MPQKFQWHLYIYYTCFCFLEAPAYPQTFQYWRRMRFSEHGIQHTIEEWWAKAKGNTELSSSFLPCYCWLPQEVVHWYLPNHIGPLRTCLGTYHVWYLACGFYLMSIFAHQLFDSISKLQTNQDLKNLPGVPDSFQRRDMPLTGATWLNQTTFIQLPNFHMHWWSL